MTKNFGFTLAEVLITLGIIGVVAAMTMPTLINQTNGAQYKAAYKKALSAISQGVTLNVALDDIGFAETVEGGKGTNTTDNSVAKILSQRMNVVKVDKTVGYGTAGSPALQPADDALKDGANNTTLFFNDGSVFQFDPSTGFACTDESEGATKKICKGFIDVNGLKGPNKIVKCSSGSGTSCVVKSPTDVYPVKFYDQTILPNSAAASAVLYGK